MSLSDATVQELRELLRETMALVYVGGKPVESAFFITEDLLLTCAHESEVSPVQVEIEPYGRKRSPAKVVGWDHEADVMLLQSQAEDGDLSPCVVLARYERDAPDGAVSFVGGYPRDSAGRLKCEVVTSPVNWRGDPSDDDSSLSINPGQIVTWGMSGGPVVSISSGAVIGIVKSSKHVGNALGGSAIPINLAAKVLSQVGYVQNNQNLAMVPWRNVLGQVNWQQLRRPWNMGDRIDLWITGDRTHWEVSIEHGGTVFKHEGPDLGKRVAEAIFHWAQRRHHRNAGEVALLGQLLARALFPAELPLWLKVLGWADDLLVCLHIEPENDQPEIARRIDLLDIGRRVDLFDIRRRIDLLDIRQRIDLLDIRRRNDLLDIPWELTADPFPGKQDQFLAADQSVTFTRVVDAGGGAVAPPQLKSAADLKILAVVAKPLGWEYKDIHLQAARARRTPLNADTMRGKLTTCIGSSGLAVTPLVPPTPHGMDGALKTAEPYDVLHYMGAGAVRDGQAEIVFMNHDSTELWKTVREVIETAGRTGVRLVVLELMQVPEDWEFQQLTCRDLGDVIAGTVTAAVLTTHPVYPTQCEMFNRAFYESLGSGATIEKAVQEARWAVRDSTSAMDAAGFGWFTVVTGSLTDVRLVTPPPSHDPGKSGVRGTGTPPTEGTGDV